MSTSPHPHRRALLAPLLGVAAWLVLGAVLVATDTIGVLPAQDPDHMAPAQQQLYYDHMRSSEFWTNAWWIGLAILVAVALVIGFMRSRSHARVS